MKKSILLLSVLVLAACAMPKIVILEDPLTAQQHNDLGVAYEEKGDFALAGKEYEKALGKNREWVIPYLNRLSDALFVAARWENRRQGVPDVLWDSRA